MEPTEQVPSEEQSSNAAEVIRQATLVRYEHGGGRLFVDSKDGTGRKLICDFYDEETREFIVALLHKKVEVVK